MTEELELYDWIHESDPVIRDLKYIASAPAERGFEPRIVSIAQQAVARIRQLQGTWWDSFLIAGGTLLIFALGLFVGYLIG